MLSSYRVLDTTDEHVAICLMNALEDLVFRRQPAGLAEYAPRIHDVLAALERRFALIASAQAAKIRARLSPAGK